MTLRVGNIPQLAGVPYKALAGLSFISYEENLPDLNFQRLCSGDLDAALISVVDFVSRSDLLALEFGMGCRSRSDSMVLYARDSLEELDTIHVYGCSRSSQILTQLLFRECFGRVPKVVRHAGFDPLDCIGKNEGALRLHELPNMQREGYRVHKDVAAWWHERTRLPFVFLVWALRSSCNGHEWLPRLNTWLARSAHISEGLARDFSGSYGTTPNESSVFVGGNRRYHIDAFLMGGLREFLQRSQRAGLLVPAGYHRALRPLLNPRRLSDGAMQ